MATIDLKDAYYHIPIHQSSQKYLRFAVPLSSGVLHLQFTYLHSESALLTVFLKRLTEVVAQLRLQSITVILYVDDLLVVAKSAPQLNVHLQEVILHLQSLGWILNWEKSSLASSTQKFADSLSSSPAQ